ncbi:MAG: ribbon-helix-helix domain-containing protein [Candidatus Taylorbacteria bacterium]
MRTVINISLPKELKKEVESAVKRDRYASKSEFFRDLLRMWKDDQLLKDLKESQREFAQGKGKVLKSLKDLG